MVPANNPAERQQQTEAAAAALQWEVSLSPRRRGFAFGICLDRCAFFSLVSAYLLCYYKIN